MEFKIILTFYMIIFLYAIVMHTFNWFAGKRFYEYQEEDLQKEDE